MAKTLAQRAKEIKARTRRGSLYETNIIKHLASEEELTISLCGRNFRLKRFKIVTRAQWRALEESQKCKKCISLEN